ncbi:MAG: type II toxin-antitoxin system RelE family toxin [Vicinamibacteria bacterium]
MPRRHEIEIAPTGLRSFKAIKEKRLRRQIAKVIDGLALAPEKQGKPLLGPLEGVRSVRAARDRYRILYRIDSRAKLVSVLLVGERLPGRDADIYALATRLLATFTRRGED